MIRLARSFSGVLPACMAALSSCVIALAAENPATDFESANLLYEKGQYGQAIRAYESILAGGTRTPALLFNLGNAHFKTEQIGRAIASWLQAEALDPRNDRIQINLEFARNKVGGGATPIPMWPDQLKRLTVNEWAGALLSASWLFFGGLAIGVWKPNWRPPLRVVVLVSGVALAILGTLLLITASDRASTVSAVVIADEAVIRFGPLKESQSAFVARDGTEFRAADFKDEWIRVEDATGREGWLTIDQVFLLRGGRPLDQ